MPRLLHAWAGILMLSVAAGAAAADPPKEPITGLPLPLLEGEQLSPLKDGCNLIVPPGTAPTVLEGNKRYRWYGACRFGLADGPGFIGADGAGPAPEAYPVTQRLGRYDRRAGKNVDSSEYYRRDATDDSEWNFTIYGSPEEAREASRRAIPGLGESLNGDRSWIASMASVRKKNDRELFNEMVWVRYQSCPSLAARMTVAKQMEADKVPPEQRKLLIPFCEQAYARLKRDGMVRPEPFLPFGVMPFEPVSYGYYYTVEQRRSTQPTGQAAVETIQVTVCPSPGDQASCETLWRPMVAPYLAVRDAKRKREAEVEARREEMIAALEAAFQLKLKRALAAPAARRTK